MTAAGIAATYGPVALVTGASSGIGEAFARRLAALGLDLLLTARRVDRLEAIARSIRETHCVEVHVVAADLGCSEGCEQVLDAASALDVGLVILNAGWSLRGEFETLDIAAMTAMLRVNCEAPLVLAHALVPALKRRGRGGLIFTSSVEALIGCPFSAAYSASKAMLKNLGEALWAELNPCGIDVLVLCPGATDTEALARSGADIRQPDAVMSATDVAGLTLENLANGPVFLSSDHYRAVFDRLLAMPRRDALSAMAAGTRAAATGNSPT